MAQAARRNAVHSRSELERCHRLEEQRETDHVTPPLATLSSIRLSLPRRATRFAVLGRSWWRHGGNLLLRPSVTAHHCFWVIALYITVHIYTAVESVVMDNELIDWYSQHIAVYTGLTMPTRPVTLTFNPGRAMPDNHASSPPLSFFYRLDALPATKPTVSKHWTQIIQEAQLSPSDRAMRLVSSNLANYHATVQKLLI